MQPLPLAGDPKARLVQMLDAFRLHDAVAHELGEVSPAPGLPARHARQRRCAHLGSEQIAEDLGQASLGHEMPVLQVGGAGGDARAVLHRPAHIVGECSPR